MKAGQGGGVQKRGQFGLAVTVHGPLQLQLPVSVQLQRLQQPVKVLHLAENDAEVAQADRLQRLRRQRQHLGVGLGGGGADQFDPGLPKLALLPGARLHIAKDAAGVAEALRHRPVVQAGADQPGHGDGHVGAQGEHAAVAIQETAQLRLQLGAAAAAKGIGVLERWRDHVAVAPGTEDSPAAPVPGGGGARLPARNSRPPRAGSGRQARRGPLGVSQ